MADDEIREAQGKFLGRFVIEILGTPKEHVKETLTTYVQKLKDDPELKIEKDFIAEPEEKGKAFASYAELEVWFKDLEQLFAFCLDAMPSSVEILEPSDFPINSVVLTNMLNDLQAKLHEVDMTVKRLRVENKSLQDNAGNLLKNLVIQAVKTTNKSSEQIAMEVGVTEDSLQPFLDQMVKDNVLKLVEDKWYSVG